MDSISKIQTTPVTRKAISASEILEAFECSFPSILTGKAYRRDISRFLKFIKKNYGIGPGGVSHSIILSYVSYLDYNKLSGVSINRNLSSIRAFYAFLSVYLNRNFNDPTLEVKRKRVSKKGVTAIYTRDEINRIIDVSKKQPLHWRVLVLMMIYTGFRISDCLRAKSNSIKGDMIELKVKRQEIVMKRIPKFLLKDISLLRDYYSGKGYRVKHRDFYLFMRIDKARTLKISPISRESSVYIISKILKEAEIKKEGRLNHSFRVSYATNLLNAGVSIVDIKDELGHSSIETTFRYLRGMDSINRESWKKLGY